MEKQTKRVTSITKKIHRNLIWNKFITQLGMDFLLVVMMFLTFIIQSEYSYFGSLSLDRYRTIKVIGKAPYLIYKVKDLDLVMEQDLLLILTLMAGVLSVLLILQILGIFINYIHQRNKIRKILAPIDEIALQAEKLSQMDYSEDKYHVIEDAISHMHAEDNDLLDFNDRDLLGVETAMNNLIKAMRENNRQQARFVNDASHELRTPIAVFEGYVNMLARWGKSDEKVLDESIQALQRESKHMKYLVEQLLFLARGDSGKTHLEITDVSLKDCMQEIFEESLLIDEDHVYRYHPDQDIIVQADANLLKQAVRILVDNAAKYTNKDEEIILSIGYTDQNKSYLQVQDTGIGMKSADVEHMFERFYRSDLAREYKGTGLGLSIAKWIVDKHHGYFDILSRPDLGTRIRIVL